MMPRFSSSGRFLFDAFSVSLVLVIFDNGTAQPLAFLWLGSSFLMAGAAFLAFWKFPYHSGSAAAIALASMVPALFLGMPLWLAAILAALAVYLLHARFAEWDADAGQDGNTLLLWVLVYLAVLFIDLLSADRGAAGEANAIILAAFSFYVLFHLAHRFLHGRTAGAKLWQPAVAGAAVLSAAAAAALAVYWIGPTARNFAGTAAGWLLQGVLWPFAPLMEKAANYFSGLSSTQEAQETFAKLQTSEAPEELQQAAADYSPSEFPVELFFGAGAVLIILLLFFYLRRTKPALQTELPASPAEEVRFSSIGNEEAVQASEKVRYSEMPLEIIRQSYRLFEQEAQSAGLGRHPHETVKEWMNRMEWPASDSFFRTYEKVRYGLGTVAEKDALPFLEEIKKIKAEYFHL